jgi:hypothetical protein
MANYDGKQVIRDLKAGEAEIQMVARKYPVGTKLHQTNGGPTGEIIAIHPDGCTVTVRTAGVDRPAPYTAIDRYVAEGRLTVERPVRRQ